MFFQEPPPIDIQAVSLENRLVFAIHKTEHAINPLGMIIPYKIDIQFQINEAVHNTKSLPELYERLKRLNVICRMNYAHFKELLESKLPASPPLNAPLATMPDFDLDWFLQIKKHLAHFQYLIITNDHILLEAEDQLS